MSTSSCIAGALGVSSHICYFVHGEHHMKSVLYLQIALSFPILGTIGLWVLTQSGIIAAAEIVFNLEAIYLCSVWASMLFYRVSTFHRLRDFPGPILWRLTKFTQSWENRGLRGFEALDRLHQQYGDFVRTGPSELSITHPDGVDAILGPGSKCSRSPWASMADPLQSIFETRDKAKHDKRRRAWDQGFSVKALHGYKPLIEWHAKQLEDQMAYSVGKAMNVSLWFNYYSFDVMGDLTFGRSFDMLKTGKEHFLLSLLENGQKALGVIGPLPWLFIILTKIPFISAEIKMFQEWCESQMLGRKKAKLDIPDIMSCLLEAEPMSPDPIENHKWLNGDTRIAIVAGSSTTAAIITWCFYYLAKDSVHISLIRRELALLPKYSQALDVDMLQTNAPYLNAFITESLRLHPPNASGVLRQSPSEGLWIGDYFVPGDITLCVPFWTLQRSSKCFVQPQEFIPKRWTTRTDLVLRQDAWIPFSSGKYRCVGKQLAFMNIRTIIARLVMRFDIVFAPGEDGKTLLECSKDYFTTGCADLMLEFRLI